MKKKKILLCLTTDVIYDQRMQKICTSLSETGYNVTLVGFKRHRHIQPSLKKFIQKRLPLFFKKGFFLFAEANIKLFFYLLFHKADIFVANDLDTALPVYLVSCIKRKKRVFDAHELFCDTPSLAYKPRVRAIWRKLEHFLQPKFTHGYTESPAYAQEFKQKFGLEYTVVSNCPKKNDAYTQYVKQPKTLIYQGSIEKGRGFETLIPAIAKLDVVLTICGDGPFLEEVKRLTQQYHVADKVIFKGYILPEEMIAYTCSAYIGININENLGKSYYMSLPNRLFDYMQAGLPQISMNFPGIKAINDANPFAILLDDLEVVTIYNALYRLLEDKQLYQTLQNNALKARNIYNWENEAQKLIAFYDRL